MKKLIKTFCLISTFVFVNTSFSVPEGSKIMQSCLLHDEEYALVEIFQECPFPDHLLTEEDDHYTAGVPRLRPHNPECFSYRHILVSLSNTFSL